jgi:UDP-N-acetylglucosamine/UDP-N-acetylgalactosamine diphosphorylase
MSTARVCKLCSMQTLLTPPCCRFLARTTKNADCGAKVVAKRDEKERVGVLCLRNAKPSVVEYSEISQEQSEMRDANGQLVFNAANVCIHMFSRHFLQRIASDHLLDIPYHIAKKSIPSVDADGQRAMVNGWKFEKFVFDVFPFCTNMLALQV